MARGLKTRAVKGGSRQQTKGLQKKKIIKKIGAPLVLAKSVQQKGASKASGKEKAVQLIPAAQNGEKKNISQKLLETIERRKRERAEKEVSVIKKPPGRR